MTIKLKDRVRTKVTTKGVKDPVWAGPCGAGRQGGITQSLLGRYLSDPERFRVKVIQGLKAVDKFSDSLEYGNMWHICEEALGADEDWVKPLEQYTQELCRKYPMQQEVVSLWAEKCAAMFPRYVNYWAKHPDVKDRKPLFQEQVFDVEYKLPSGRTVRLRGKWDGGDVIGKARAAGVYLQENKSKSSIDAVKIGRSLIWDLQAMFYFVALSVTEDNAVKAGWSGVPLRGIRYNVVKRPAHKSIESLTKKYDEDVKDNRVGEWFSRWNIDVSTADVQRFRDEFLNPVLENLCDAYDWWVFIHRRFPKAMSVYDYEERQRVFQTHQQRHYRTPYHYDPLAEGGSGEVDSYLDTGSEAGLQRVLNLFPELQED